MTTIGLEQVVGKSTTIEHHRADRLVVHEIVQRELRPAHVQDIRRNLNPDAIGVFTINRRDDGTLSLIDGQHRRAALVDEGLGATVVTCRAFDGLAVPEEAELFRRLNKTSKTSALEDLEKAITAEEPEALAINKLLRHNGYRLTRAPGEGTIACAQALRKVFRQGASGPTALAFALHVTTRAWGAHSDSVDGHLIQGFGGLYVAFGEEIDRKALINKLAKHKGQAPGFLGQAKALADLEHVTVHRAVSRRAHGLYNKGRREGGLLPPL